MCWCDRPGKTFKENDCAEKLFCVMLSLSVTINLELGGTVFNSSYAADLFSTSDIHESDISEVYCFTINFMLVKI